MKDLKQSDKGGMANSQLTTLLLFLWIWYASRKSSIPRRKIVRKMIMGFEKYNLNVFFEKANRFFNIFSHP